MSTVRISPQPVIGDIDASPSVAELINVVEAKIIARRPHNWRSVAREKWDRGAAPFVILSEPWEPPHEGEGVGVLPARGNHLNTEMADGECCNVQLETVIEADW